MTRLLRASRRGCVLIVRHNVYCRRVLTTKRLFGDGLEIRRSPSGVHRQQRFETTNATFSGDDYLRNGGRVEGVWVFCRHGDRTPCRSSSAAHMEPVEAAFWETKLPYPDPETAFKILSRCFPLEIHPSNPKSFFDVERKPFGFLTGAGIEQMRTNGKRFFTRYDQYGHHCSDERLILGDEDRGNGFLHSWDVKAYSTNYLRTVLSVQCFLDGLLGLGCYDLEKRRLTSSIAELSLVDSIAVESREAAVKVEIRDRARDTLNAFDRNPDLMKELVSDVVSSKEFEEGDAKAAPLAARLANFLPGLGKKGRSYGGPSGINWIDATDHFVCRRAHDVRLSKFSEFEHDDRVEQTLSAMAEQTEAHLAWRFRQWYLSPPLLAAISAPPLREISQELQAAPRLGVEDRHPFTIYSCHDVTILSLLYGVGADFLADEERGSWRFWPSYASTLVFELVRVEQETGPNSHVVRILLNGHPVRSVDFLSGDKTKGEPMFTGNGPLNMLLVSEFVDLVKKLEKEGGFDSRMMGYGGSDQERDMSGWTG